MKKFLYHLEIELTEEEKEILNKAGCICSKIYKQLDNISFLTLIGTKPRVSFSKNDLNKISNTLSLLSQYTHWYFE